MQDDDNEETINVVIDYNQTLSLIIVRGGSMMPSHLTIRAEVMPDETAEEIDFDVAFAKIKFWFETIVSHSVVLCRNNKNVTDILLQSDGRPRMVNHMMMTPFEPTDEHLAVLFQSKMTALSGGMLQFGCVRVESDISNGLVFTYVGDWEKDLPAMKDWFDVTPYYFERPWWTRDDASVTDFLIDGADVAVFPPWAFKLDFIETSLRPNKNDNDPKASAARGAFTPKIIDGGRQD